MRRSDRIWNALAALYALDRVLKVGAVERFFHPSPLPAPTDWPTVTLLQPITRGAADLERALDARARLDYPAPVQHLLVCDANDAESQASVSQFRRAHPHLAAEMIIVGGRDAGPALKTVKLQAGLAHATCEVICCVDDDVILRPESLRTLVAPLLQQPRVGATFGLACYVGWDNLPSSLMSAFVNANALLSYVPLTFMAEPFTITGHCFALCRATLDAVGGFTGLEDRIDDDHDLAQRVRAVGLHNVQTALVYDVVNVLPSLRAYRVQFKRWFIFPREALLPYLSSREKLVSMVGSVGNLLPAMLLMAALLTRGQAATRAALTCLMVFGGVYAWCERRYLRRTTPLKRWLVLPFVAWVAPWQIVSTLLGDSEIEWRGQRLRITRGGGCEVIR